MGASFPPPLTAAEILRLAPRRSRLTKTISGGIVEPPDVTANFVAGAPPATFMLAIPIEAPCYAVRLGFLNPFDAAMTIASASVWSSDSYSACAAMLAAGGASQVNVAPTNGTEYKLYFDNAGADNPVINTGGTARGLTLAANPANPSNSYVAIQPQWSDWVPCLSIPRADGGTQHLLFLYVTISSTNFAQAQGLAGAAQQQAYNLDPVAPRGRFIYSGCAWLGGTDYADNPSGTAWKTTGGPWHFLQYLTANPGIQVVSTGDSLTAGAPTNDYFSSSLQRAAFDLSTPAFPIEVACAGCNGQDSGIYDAQLRYLLAALLPSVLAYQPISENDGMTTASLQIILAKCLASLQTAALSGAGVTWNIPGLMPAIDGNNSKIAAWNDMYGRLVALAAQTGVPLIDATTVMSGTNPWDYKAGCSDDNLHPNFAGAELLVPASRRALATFIG